ncbi:MAG: flagellin [Candidatus Magnetomorum sp.]|nr:flagellin [Candidatus Magnetomorum sp.]
MSIQTNAINATYQKSQDVINRLSSGLRINKASDDISGFAIAERKTSQVNGLYKAARNLGDGISMVQTADAALDQGSELLQRMRELAVQANNGTLNNSDRANIQKEIDQLHSEFDDIAENASFNNQSLFDASFSGTIQMGDSSNEGVKIQLGDLRSLIGNIDVTDETGADAAVQNLDSALENINDTRSHLGATQNRFESAMNELQNASAMHSKSRSVIMDTDFAADISENDQNKILSQVQMAMLKKNNHSKTFLMELFN